APAAALRNGCGRSRHHCAPPGRGGRDQRSRPQRREAADARAAADADRRAGCRRHRRDQRHLVQPAVARRPAQARNRGPAAREGLALKRDALAAVHRPRDLGEAETGRQRLAFEELLVLQVGIARRAAERERTLAPALGEPGDLIHRYRNALPFALTPYQEQAIREIDGDLARTVPMQRLLQGDVGSGKTVVALYALLRAVESGRQGALMAPTETLAEQHFL